jgi:23S rRNA (uracil1939-C5)-methyltransferase
MEEPVIQALAQHPAKELLYVSCDPASLARDTARLATAGWRLEAAWPLDMFPQTYHVETLARFTR